MTDKMGDWLEQALRELETKEAAKELRRRHPYVIDLIEVLKPHPRGLARRIVLHTLEKRRQRDGLPIPPSFEKTVQSFYNRSCVDSAVFIKRKAPLSEGLFHSPGGKGSGTWAVHSERAATWLRRKLVNGAE